MTQQYSTVQHSTVQHSTTQQRTATAQLSCYCGVKQWVYTSVATKLCCSGVLLCGAVWCCVVLCGAVLLRHCSSALLELQHELLQHWVDTFSSNPSVVTLQ